MLSLPHVLCRKEGQGMGRRELEGWEEAKGGLTPPVFTVLHQFQDDVQVVLRANGVNIFDDVGVVQLLEEKDLRFDGGQVLGLHIGQLEALDSHKVACVCDEGVSVWVGVSTGTRPQYVCVCVCVRVCVCEGLWGCGSREGEREGGSTRHFQTLLITGGMGGRQEGKEERREGRLERTYIECLKNSAETTSS